MTFVFSTTTSLKIAIKIFTLIKCNPKRKMKIRVKPFFYLSIDCHDRKFTNELLDKRDAFFHVNHMSYLDRNISCKIFYTSICSEILHIARETTYLVNTVNRANLLSIWMKK